MVVGDGLVITTVVVVTVEVANEFNKNIGMLMDATKSSTCGNIGSKARGELGQLLAVI